MWATCVLYTLLLSAHGSFARKEHEFMSSRSRYFLVPFRLDICSCVVVAHCFEKSRHVVTWACLDKCQLGKASVLSFLSFFLFLFHSPCRPPCLPSCCWVLFSVKTAPNPVATKEIVSYSISAEHTLLCRSSLNFLFETSGHWRMVRVFGLLSQKKRKRMVRVMWIGNSFKNS